MYSRLSLIGALALAISATASAEPAKPDVRAAAKPANRPPALVLASAEQPVAPEVSAPDQAQPSPMPKKRVARVTTCRCADQANSGQ